MIIYIENFRTYAYHGVLPQERLVGGEFVVSVRADVDVQPEAYEKDKLEGTVSYVDILDDIKNAMSNSRQLLECVATDIAKKILTHEKVSEVWVRVAKCNPPMGVDLESAGVETILTKGK